MKSVRKIVVEKNASHPRSCEMIKRNKGFGS